VASTVPSAPTSPAEIVEAPTSTPTIGSDRIIMRPRVGKPCARAETRSASARANLGDLIVDSMPECVTAVRAMIDAYDRYYGTGSGEAFFTGPYLDILPRAVSEWMAKPNH